MEYAPIEIWDFLAARPTIDTLPPAPLDAAPLRFVIRYPRRGNAFAAADDVGPNLYIPRTDATEPRNTHAYLFDRLGEGDARPYAGGAAVWWPSTTARRR